MKNLTRFRIFLAPLSCIAVFLCTSLGSLVQLAISSPPAPTKSILPAAHGIPDIIAGYRVLAVRTSETTRCMAPGTAIVTIQVDTATIDEALLTTDVQAVYRELERLHPDSGISWYVEIVSPSGTFEEIVAGNDQLNSHFAEHDCLPPSVPISDIFPDETDGMP